MSNPEFTRIQVRKPERSVFDHTHDVKMSGKMGTLYPCMVMDVLPGDHVHIGCEALMRFAPLLAPVMHRADLYIHYWFVPNRLVWDGWEEFITGDVAAARVMPTFGVTSGASAGVKAFLDYMGVPPAANTDQTDSAILSGLAVAAYQCIYNEWYRDQNLIAEVPFQLVDGANVPGNYCVLRQRAWEHDYFTSNLPFAQKGSAIDIPLGVVELDPGYVAAGSIPVFQPDPPGVLGGAVISDNSPGAGISIGVPGTGEPAAYDPDGSLVVGATTIADLRTAYKLQEWLELNARAGTRYTENTLAHFNVRSPDSRLQRPEYITGVKSPVNISEVLNTTGPTDYYDGTSVEQTGSPQGTMSGHAVSVMSGRSGSYFCQEHGYIIGILSVLPKTAYQQGIPKHWLRDDFLDFYWPKFAHLGEQAVQNQELYGYTVNKADTFGYIPRYAEYRSTQSRVAGDFRTTLNYWHMSRIFSSLPSLGQAFIECDDAEVNRIFAVQTGADNLWMHILHKIRAVRPIPKYGTPY